MSLSNTNGRGAMRSWSAWASAGLAVIGASVLYRPAVPFVLAWAGWALTGWLVPRVTADRVCVRLARWSYCLKIGLAFALFAASVARWPIPVGLYHGGEGFWIFAYDAQAYHNFGLAVVKAWAGHGEFPRIDFSNWSYLAYISLLYRWLGVHPLIPSVLNAWYGTFMVCAGLSIVRCWKAPVRVQRWMTGLLGFWPSLLLWSSQAFKDPLILTLIMLGLAALVSLLAQPSPAPAGRLSRSAWQIGIVAAALTFFRSYVGLCFGVLVVATTVCLAVRAVLQRAHRQVGGLAVIAAVTVVAVIRTEQFDVSKVIMQMSRPARPPAAAAAPQPVAVRIASDQLTPRAPAATEAPPPDQPSEPPSEPPHASSLLSAIMERDGGMAQQVPDKMNDLRQGFINTGGKSIIDPKVEVGTPLSAVRYLPRSLVLVFLAPFPRQWFEIGGDTAVFRRLASIEMILIYLLLVGCLCRWRELRPYLGAQTAVLGCFILLVAVPMALTVANLGTLFRLRLQFLMPLLVLISVVDIPQFYLGLPGRLRRRIK